MHEVYEVVYVVVFRDALDPSSVGVVGVYESKHQAEVDVSFLLDGTSRFEYIVKETKLKRKGYIVKETKLKRKGD